MPGSKEAFLKMLDPGAQAPGAAEDPLADLLPEGDATMDPADARLDLETDVDPTTQEGETIFLDPEMFASTPKKGSEVRLTCRVNNSQGSKISLTPMAVEDDNSDEIGQDEVEEED